MGLELRDFRSVFQYKIIDRNSKNAARKRRLILIGTATKVV